MANLVTLETKLASLKDTAAKFLPKLKKLGIETVRDLLWHFPSRYEDFSKVSKINSLKPGDQVTIRAEIKRLSSYRSFKRHMTIVEALVADETGGISLVWFNQPFIAKTLSEGTRANFAGKVFTSPKGGLSISNPSYEVLRGTSQTTHTAGLIPVYPETRGLTSKGVRYLTKLFLEIIEPPEDFIPASVLEANHLPRLALALKHIHFPKTNMQALEARTRFSFEYLFLLQLNNLRFRAALNKEKAPQLAIGNEELENILATLPFTLTESQKTTLQEILDDISKARPMNRLLQGDVGSGKTVVAALAALIAAHQGYQAVFMAPTEVLARQHYATLTKMFPKMSFGVGLITGSECRIYFEEHLEEKKTKKEFEKAISAGAIKIIIGTHALIAKGKKNAGLTFPNLGLVIVDEQHRFGVDQRAALLGKKNAQGTLPHFLSMSATPIPRTLTLTVFGDLDLSTINELPKGRKSIITKVVDPDNRKKAYAFIRQNIDAGRQAFFIFPRIEKTEGAPVESATDKRKLAWSEVKTVKEEYEKLSKEIFPDLTIGMLHGKMKAAEKKKIMEEFKRGAIDILASTSVVEVGLDVPNATVMVIEGADRFGLSQLYQFRGRVGRGTHQSFCLLFTDSHAKTAHDRLTALLEAKNGFELAEKDLALRGPGEFLGTKQTGIPDMAMDALSNIQLVKKAQDAAKKLLKKDPELQEAPLLKKKLTSLNKQIHLE